MLKLALKKYKKGKLIYLHFPSQCPICETCNHKECIIFNGFFWNLTVKYQGMGSHHIHHIYSKDAGIIKEDYT